MGNLPGLPFVSRVLTTRNVSKNVSPLLESVFKTLGAAVSLSLFLSQHVLIFLETSPLALSVFHTQPLHVVRIIRNACHLFFTSVFNVPVFTLAFNPISALSFLTISLLFFSFQFMTSDF